VTTSCGTRENESVNTLISRFPADGPQPPILPPRDGFLFQDRDKFPASFGADLPADLAAFMADSQVPWGVDAAAGQVTDPAWRTKPSWYLVATEDRMTPPRRPSASCPSGPAPLWSRWPAATLSTCHSRQRWPRSSNKPHLRSPGRSQCCRGMSIILGRPPIRAAQDDQTGADGGRTRLNGRDTDALRSAPVITSDQSWQT
jgi:hypothetical protein